MDLRLRWLEGMSEVASLVPLKRMDELEASGKAKDDSQALQKLQSYWIEGSSFVVAELNSDKVGFGIGITKDDYYFVNKVYVVPNLRRRGIGRAIEIEQISHAKRLGLRELCSYVSWANHASTKMQEGFGARKTFSNPCGFIFSIKL